MVTKVLCVRCVYKIGVWEADTLVYLSPEVNSTSEYNVSVQLDGTLSAPVQQTFTVLDNPVLNGFDKKTHVGDILQLTVCYWQFNRSI